MKHLIVSLHDVHPGSLELVSRQRQLLSSWGVGRCSLLMVPRFHHQPCVSESPQLVRWASERQNQGDELILHGYFHDRVGAHDPWSSLFWTRFYTNREAEFFDLALDLSRQRLEEGVRLFQSLNWKVTGFIAPAWLMTPGLPDLLRELGFHYTNTIGEILLLKPQLRRVPSRSLCWSVRAGWRRACSLVWNSRIFPAALRGEVLRLSLHPRDFEYEAVQRQVAEKVKTALDAGFHAVTYGSYATG